MTDLNRFAKHADIAAQVIQQVMVNNLNMMPPTEYILTTHNGNVWLVAAMDTLALGGRLEPYENPNVAHQLSTALSSAFGSKSAISVITTNHTGLRYCVLFGNPPTLPNRVEFSNFGAQDVFRFGMGLRGEVTLPARLMKNIIIGAAQEMGKSNVLRLVAHQARAFDWSLYLADSQAHTFNPDVWNGVAAHPVAGSTDQVLGLLSSLRGVLDDRAAQFRATAAGGIPPADIDAYNAMGQGQAQFLPRVLFAIDEASTPLQDKRVFKELAALLREGRKFGLHIIMAGHEWHKEVIPAEVNDMMQTRIALPMIDENSGYVVTRSRTWGKWVIGKQAGRGVLRTNVYTPIQFYLVMPEQEAEWLVSKKTITASPLPEKEMVLVQRSLTETKGKMTLVLLQGWGLSEWEARSLLERYEARGWVEKNPRQGNARCLTAKLTDLLSNHQTAQSRSIPQIEAQTILKASQLPDPGFDRLKSATELVVTLDSTRR